MNLKTVTFILSSLLYTAPILAAGSQFNYSPSALYSVRQDFAQPRDPKTTLSRLQFSNSLTIYNQKIEKDFDEELADEIVSLSLKIGAQYTMIGTEIDATNPDSYNGLELSDLDFSAAKSIKLNSFYGAKSSLDISIGTSLPTSLESQYEGIHAVPYADITWLLGFRNNTYSLTQSLSTDYISNEYNYSPVTREVNPESSLGYLISMGARLGYGFRLIVGGTARIIHYYDTTNTLALSNTQTLSWSNGRVSAKLTYSNGARPQDRETTMWFTDEYRRFLSLSAMVRF